MTKPWTKKTNELLKKHEGLRLKPYRCSENYLTIGYGRNIETRGILEEEAEFLLQNDIQNVVADIYLLFKDEWRFLPDNVKIVLANMRFQLGSKGFRSFKQMINAVRVYDYDKMIKEMLDSVWAKKQTPERAMDLVGLIQESKR